MGSTSPQSRAHSSLLQIKLKHTNLMQLPGFLKVVLPTMINNVCFQIALYFMMDNASLKFIYSLLIAALFVGLVCLAVTARSLL